MWRWIRRILGGVGLLLTIAALAGAVYQARATRRDLSAYPPPGGLVDVGGHRLHIWCTGTGSPSVVLDTGLGGTAFDWGYVQPAVAEFTHVCSYDRAGMGYSDSGPGSRTSQQIVREFRALLDRSGIRGRVILVGASVGGWNMRLFASTQEDRVAGLVLVDARHEEQGDRLLAAGVREAPPRMGLMARLAPAAAYLGIARAVDFAPGLAPSSVAPSVRPFVQATRFRTSAFATAADELRHASQSAEQVKAARRRLDLPLVVISASERGEQSIVEILDGLQRDHLALSKYSCQVIATRSGHVIAVDQPEIVVDAIRATVAASRQGTLRPNCDAITPRGSEVSSACEIAGGLTSACSRM